ncbi:MAG: alpha/beta hydrolase [Mariniphaga sp.]|nr:alpha/beta hydrolase [Mariniphaga sp.]MDD4224826.1 alpha/beta hydrolase [Mariniphaga sp.]
MIKKLKRYFIVALLILVSGYLLGPRPSKPLLDKNLLSLPATLRNIEAYVRDKESELNIKTDNESRIIWANDSTKERTDYCLLYLHGFSASWYEGFPAHMEFASYFGMNAYLARLAAHGLETADPLISMSPDDLWDSAKEALMLARSLGKKVVIMGTSTGGTLALQLAADFPEYVDGLILYSPNVRIYNSASFLLSKPWGLQIGRKFNGGKYRISDDPLDSIECRYWYCKYRMEGVVSLQQLVERTMTKETFQKVNVPVFLGYYYKDKNHQDKTVRVSAMLKMFDQLGTSPSQKVKVPFPEAGDHVIACELTSGSSDEVIRATIHFTEDVMKLKRKIQ